MVDIIIKVGEDKNNKEEDGEANSWVEDGVGNNKEEDGVDNSKVEDGEDNNKVEAGEVNSKVEDNSKVGVGVGNKVLLVLEVVGKVNLEMVGTLAS